MEVRPYSYFRLCGFFWGPWVSFLSEGHKIYFKDWCLIKSQPTFLFFSPNLSLMNYGHIIKKACKPDNFQSHNSQA